MDDIKALAEKKLKARMRKIRKCNNHEDEKLKFLEKFGISFEIEFQNKNPDKLNDGFTLFTTPEGKVLLADYFYQIPEDDEYVSVPVPEKDLKAILKFFDGYKLELDDVE